MPATYPILLNGRNIGKAEVEKQGLYYRFDCRCSFPDEGLYTISVKNGAYNKSLGVCTQEGSVFRIKTSIPIKHFPEQVFTFTASMKSESGSHNFVPLHLDQPFAYIRELNHAVFTVCNGKPGVNLRLEASDPSAESPAGQ